MSIKHRKIVSETENKYLIEQVVFVLSSVVDAQHFYADLDSTYHPDADPDVNPDSDFFVADPDPDPSFRINVQKLEKC
jgi:hypothetical protein